MVVYPIEIPANSTKNNKSTFILLPLKRVTPNLKSRAKLSNKV